MRFRAAQRAVELLPESQDAMDGPAYLLGRAAVHARPGQSGPALDLIEHLLQVPSGLSVNELRIDPRRDRLRNDARFQRLLESAAG